MRAIRSCTISGAQALERFVEEDDPGVADECSGDRQHLLLAARQGPAPRRPALLQAREDFPDPVEGPALRCGEAGDAQVLLHREGAEDGAFFGHELHADPRDLLGW